MARTKTRETRVNGAHKAEYADEDVGNIVLLEHVNVTIPDQALSTTFYVLGLGFARDPYMMVGLNNMWVNAGEQQFHLPTNPPQVVPGHIGLVVPDLDALLERLKGVEDALDGTRFAYARHDDHVAVTCPWGNQFRAHAPHPRFGDITLGVPYVELSVPRGAAAPIARFYEKVLGAPSVVDKGGEAAARVTIGTSQWLVFRETDEPIPDSYGHHIAVYVSNFSGPYNWLKQRDLIMEEVRNHQFRFKTLVDPGSGEPAYTLEHEVRSLFHPLYRRPLVNRNPGQQIRDYHRGEDALEPLGR